MITIKNALKFCRLIALLIVCAVITPIAFPLIHLAESDRFGKVAKKVAKALSYPLAYFVVYYFKDYLYPKVKRALESEQ